MPLPWLRLIDGMIGATDVVRWVRGRASGEPQGGGPLEARLAGVVVAALKEAFDRDHQRLDIERQRTEEEKQRAERALRLELQRQAGDRELGRLRLIGGAAITSLLATLFLVTRIAGAAPSARILVGLGWLSLIGAAGASFNGQSRVVRFLARGDDRGVATDIGSSGAASAASWLTLGGLAVIAIGVLLV